MSLSCSRLFRLAPSGVSTQPGWRISRRRAAVTRKLSIIPLSSTATYHRCTTLFILFNLLDYPYYPTFFERQLVTHFRIIFWIILFYDVTTNDTHDSNGRPLLRIAL